MINTSKVYQEYVVFVESKSLRGRSKYLRQVRKLAEYYPSRSLKQLTERQLFDYLIFRRDEQKLRPSTLNQAVVQHSVSFRASPERNFRVRRNHRETIRIRYIKAPMPNPTITENRSVLTSPQKFHLGASCTRRPDASHNRIMG